MHFHQFSIFWIKKKFSNSKLEKWKICVPINLNFFLIKKNLFFEKNFFSEIRNSENLKKNYFQVIHRCYRITAKFRSLFFASFETTKKIFFKGKKIEKSLEIQILQIIF